MSTFSYKCPNCSAPLTFRPELDKLKCDYCGSAFTIEEIDQYIKDNPDKNIKEEVKNESEHHDHSHDTESHTDEGNHNTGEDSGHYKGYTCQNCGAEVVTSDTTLTTFCYYCHSPVVLTDRAQGDFKPDKIIPFKIDRKKAENIFLLWAKNKRYVKKDFYSTSQLEKITGMYLPYWALNSKYSIDVKGTGYKKSTYRRGDTEYTDTSSYNINRQGDFQVSNLSEIAYTKVDKPLLDSITPYKFEDAVDFKIFYMNGFFSETYDKKYSDVESNLIMEADKIVRNSVKGQLSEYNNYNLDVETYDPIESDHNYLLLPTWMMTYDYNGKKYIYALNGQTGKAYGELPIDNKLIIRDAIIIGIIVFILGILGGKYIW